VNLETHAWSGDFQKAPLKLILTDHGEVGSAPKRIVQQLYQRLGMKRHPGLDLVFHDQFRFGFETKGESCHCPV
jgi:hypothetical protein